MKTYLWHFTNYNGFQGIITSKELWLRNTLKMNDVKDRTYGKHCVNSAIETCGDDSVLCKYRNFDILPETPLFDHYSMSFCLKDNAHLWNEYADKHQGIALIFDKDKLEMAIFDKCKLSVTEVVSFRHIFYEISTAEIEKLCKSLEDKFLKDCDDMHYQSRLILIKKLLFQIYTGYTKEVKWKDEDEERLCYIDEYSASYNDNMSEILRELRTGRKMKALSKLGLAPDQCLNDKYELNLDRMFSSAVLPYVFIGNACKASRKEILEMLRNNGFNTTKVLNEGDIIP